MTGVYLPHLPALSRLALRLEGGTTDVVGVGQSNGMGFFYWNVRYVDGYTADGQNLGAPISRRGNRYRAVMQYWQSARTSYLLSYTRDETSGHFLEGGNSHRVAVGAQSQLNRNIDLDIQLQYESWKYPLLRSGPSSDFAASVGMKYVLPLGRK